MWEDGLTNRLPLSLSLANACNPYCKRIPLAQDNTSRGFPPFCVPSHANPSGLGRAATILLVGPGTPRGRNADTTKANKPLCAMSPLSSDDDSDSSDSDDNTLMLATLLTLSIEVACHRCRHSGIPRRVIQGIIMPERTSSAITTSARTLCIHPTCFAEGNNHILLLLCFALTMSFIL
jgi:hypothetical protein